MSAASSLAAASRQRRIGLTGGIATGKSTVAHLLAERFGLPVLDADRFAREALGPGTAGERAVLRRYGERVRAAGEQGRAGERIDRAALGRIVFADARERRWLEALVHPGVRARFAQELERLRQEPVVVLMIPLLFEAGLETLCSEIWVVVCPEQEQLRRLMAREGLPEAEARGRIAAQWSQERKRARADVVIPNDGAGGDLEGRLRQALDRGNRGGTDGPAPPRQPEDHGRAGARDLSP